MVRTLRARLPVSRLESRPLRVLKAVFEGQKRHDLSGAAAELAYRLFLALFPFSIFLAALGGFIARLFDVQNPTAEIMDLLGNQLPPDAASVIEEQVDAVINNRDIGLLSFGIAGAVFAASSGFGTVMKVLNRMHGVRESRPAWKRYVLVIGGTQVAGLLLLAGFFLFVAGQVFGARIGDELGIGREVGWLFAYGRFPVLFLLAMVVAAFLYWAGPSQRRRFRPVTPGALLFGCGWLLASYGFGLYVSHFGSYNTTYGTLGGVVIALIWFYITGFILFLGAELDLVLNPWDEEVAE